MLEPPGRGPMRTPLSAELSYCMPPVQRLPGDTLTNHNWQLTTDNGQKSLPDRA
jgi:hypothetical protein